MTKAQQMAEKMAEELYPCLKMYVTPGCTRGYDASKKQIMDQLAEAGEFIGAMKLHVTREAAIKLVIDAASTAVPVIPIVLDESSGNEVCWTGSASCAGCPKQGHPMRMGSLRNVVRVVK
jgi:hypothetical protein